jgi:two-component system, OmpR family, response regulator
MKLLVIEDEAPIAQALRRGLQRHYLIDIAETAADGLHNAMVNAYNAILLDLGLPDMNGFHVCEQLRRENNTTPIIALTGNDDSADKVRLLDIGADDYLTKPFSLDELKARLRVVMRHSSKATSSSKLVIGELSLDTATRHVKRAGRPIRLRRKEFDLLEYLMHNHGRVVTRAALVDHAWEMDDAMWTNAVDVHIKYLRDKVDRPFSKAMIKTVHGVGYKLEIGSFPVALQIVLRQEN